MPTSTRDRRVPRGSAPDWDVVVVGAGPAGLAAAAAALRSGCRVAVVDADERPGGQYWRHPPGAPESVPRRAEFTALAGAVQAGAAFLAQHEVWTVVRTGGGFVVHASTPSGPSAISGSTLVLATGAYDRQLPFPGWDLPGVYTAGAAQTLLKAHEVAVGSRVVVGGTGPFLLPVAAGLARHGTTVAGVFEAGDPAGWLRQPGAVAAAGGKLAEAARYVGAMARRGVCYRTRHAVVAAEGNGRVEAVAVARVDPGWSVVPGTTRTVACDAVAVGWGFTPRLELPLALGCTTRTGEDGSLVAAVDDRQATDVPGVFVAGEACGVGGADLAVAEGEVAGLAVAERLGRQAAWPDGLWQRRAALRRFAAAMHQIHPIRPGWQGWLRDDTLVCRCEEVTAGTISDAVRGLGATDARSAKLLTRAGMGWCQGRICGYAASRLAATGSGRPADERGVAARPLAFPVRLGDLARDAQWDDQGDEA